MDTCRAVVLDSYDTGPVVCSIDLVAPSAGELLVEIEAATVCGTDVHIAAGRLEHVAELPLFMGHEGCGRVAALGRGRSVDVTGAPLREGDRIVWDYPWCGRCPSCALHREPSLCERTNGYGWGPRREGRINGTFAEYMHLALQSNVLRVPEDLDAGLVSSATCALRTVMHALERLGPIRFGDTVVVLGSGAVGLYAAAAVIARGAFATVLVGAPAKRLSVASEWGLAAALDINDTTPEERVERVRKLTGGAGADVVIECAGPAPAFLEGLRMLRRGGRLMVVGQASGVRPEVDTTALKINQQSVLTSLSADISHYYDAIRFLQRHAERFRLEQIVDTQVHDLATVADALEAVRSEDAIKPVVRSLR